MNIPAPRPLGTTATLALSTPFGRVLPQSLARAKEVARTPVILSRLGDEKSRQNRGPREIREKIVASLEQAQWNSDWALGGICATTEEAAHFATAGFTWFTLDLATHLEPRAGRMSLEELDTAIVKLEDAGVFRPGWHEAYLEGTAGLPSPMDEESLARAAVRFGSALQEAEQLVQTVRTNGAGNLPDLEISFVSAMHEMPMEEFAFFCADTIRRGIIHNGVTRFAPSFPGWHELGTMEFAELPAKIQHLQSLLPPTTMVSLPEPVGRTQNGTSAHWDGTEIDRLAALQTLAAEYPARFRNWLEAAREEFPSSSGRMLVSTTEDDVRFLPETNDDDLARTFLDSLQGRQLLLATWDDVADRLQFS